MCITDMRQAQRAEEDFKRIIQMKQNQWKPQKEAAMEWIAHKLKLGLCFFFFFDHSTYHQNMISWQADKL